MRHALESHSGAPTAAIDAQFEARDGRTRLARLEHRAPLKIAKTFARPQDGGLNVCVMDASPGLLAGDHYQTNWRLEEGARVEVTTQGFTRVHPSREKPCTLETRLEVASNARLEWFPEPVMLFRDAALRSETVAHLDKNATLLASEIWCAGRVERGEAWEFASFCNRWRVFREGKPVFASSLDVVPHEFDPRAPNAFGEWTHAGNFWVFQPNSSASLIEVLWEVLESDTPLARSVYGGASSLASGDVMVSLLGRRAHDLTAMVAFFRAAIAGI